MDNFIGLLVFIVIMTVVSIARKIQEAKQEAARKQQPTLRREDLPAATRRQLYGDGPDLELDVPVAKPRRDATAAPQAPQRPESVYERSPDWELQSRDEHAPPGWEKAARAEERRMPWEEAAQQQAAPERRAPIPVAPQQRQKPQPRQSMPPAAEDPLRQAREFMEQLMGRPAPQPEPVRTPRPKRTQKQAAQRQTPQTVHHAAMPTQATAKPRAAKETVRRSPAFHELIHDLDSVRRGIILLEVLGPPKSLQDM